ncbi:MAG TPA: matrixin family metalloprotease [Gammaproteobacteria bacterium]|nr:matrixin family metalloprotease [Gammaproteobacteria bacterium]
MKKSYFTFGLIISCLSISFGQLYKVPFSQKVEKSDLILEGKVTSQRQVLIEEIPYTLNSIEVVKLLKGSPTLTSEVQVLTFGGNVNGERIFSAHTLTLRIGDEGVFFLTKQRNGIDDSNYYRVYSEKQGYYRERFNGRTKELISQFSKFNGRNTFYKELGLHYSEVGFQIESEKDNCLQFRIEPANTLSVESSSLLYFNLYVKSIEPIKLRSSSLKVNYNTNWFGQDIIMSGNLAIYSGDFNASYSLNTQDITSDVFEIKLESNALPTGLNYLDENTELLLCTFGVSIQDFDVEDPIYVENTQFDSKFYDTNGTLQETKCGEINVESQACSPEITGIDLKKSAGTESILEITGSGFIHDSAEPGDEWCGLPNDEHRVKFTDVNGDWVAPLEGDYLEWTDTKIRVKVPTEGYVNNSFNRSDYGMDEIAATGKIRVCINDNVFACTCYDTSDPSDNSNDGELYVPFAIPSRDIDPSATCIEAKSARLYSEASSFEIAFNIDALSPEAKNAFIRALNTWRCAIDINYNLNSTGKIVSLGTVPSGLFALTPIGVGDCPDGEKAIDPKSITFDASTSWHFGTSDPPTNKVDFESVALHEIGHAIGLLHTNNSDNIMYPATGAGISKRVLTNDDLDGGIFNQAKSLTPINCGSKLNPLTTDCNIPTSIKEAIAGNTKHLFPNPLSESLNIESEEKIKAVQFYNSEGIIIEEDTNINSKKYIKNVSNLSSGVYIIRIYTSNSIESLKIIKL